MGHYLLHAFLFKSRQVHVDYCLLGLFGVREVTLSAYLVVKSPV